MRVMDLSRLAAGAVTAHRSRSLLTSLGIAVGIAAVVLLTSIGESNCRVAHGHASGCANQ